MKYIDNHAHLNFKIFENDLEDVLGRMKEAEVGAILVGTNKATSAKAVELAEKYDNLWAIVGLHPIHTTESFHDEEEIGQETPGFKSSGEEFDKEYYRKLAESTKCVGIGECGFDFYRLSPDLEEKQEKAFRGQVELALELGKPLMLHMRSGNDKSAYTESLRVLKELGAKEGEAHFFAGTVEDAKEFLDLGFHISFTGVVTFAKQYKELVEAVPLERLLSETDSPYVAPVPFRGKRCEPTFVIEVVKKMAEIKETPVGEFSEKILQNSKRLWKI